MFRYVKKKQTNPITLKEHFLRRNKVLIKRKYGGHGDIVMQRMMFEDFSTIFPEIDLHYCCPQKYLQLASDQPFAKTTPIEKIKEREYGIIYDISTACRVYESMHLGSNTLHRSDIWARHCGVKLNNHKCHLQAKNIEIYKEALNSINDKKLPTVLFVTKSTPCEFGQAKSLTDQQIYETCKLLQEEGYFVFTIHDSSIEIFQMMNIPQFINIELESWVGLVEAAEYVISIDTGTFHIAGALKKPLVGIFSFTNGKVYGKYFDFELVQKHKDNGDWECGPCFMFIQCPKSNQNVKPCMTELTSQQIMQSFKKVVEKTKKLEFMIHKT